MTPTELRPEIAKYLVPETWRCIAAYHGIYEVSNMGRVRSLDRIVSSRDRRGGNCGSGTKPERFLRGQVLKQVTRDGLSYVVLSKFGQNMTQRIHTLVAKTFLEVPGPDRVVKHINGIRTDNRATNLELVNKSDLNT